MLAVIALAVKSISWRREEPQYTGHFMLARLTAFIFVSVALYRTIFVSSYPGLLVWFDTIFNSPFLIRCIATFAELSYVGIMVILLHKLDKSNPILRDENKCNGFLTKLPYFAFACILVSQFLAFAGLITQNNIPFVVEEALWGVAYVSMLPLIIVRLRLSKKHGLDGNQKLFLTVMAMWCIGYGLFQFGYGLPFIHMNDLTTGTSAVPENALSNSIFNFTQTRDFDTWGGIGFMIWHSAYFSVCSWLVLIFMWSARKKTEG